MGERVARPYTMFTNVGYARRLTTGATNAERRVVDRDIPAVV